MNIAIDGEPSLIRDNRRIMAVDDDPSVLLTLKALLLPFGFHVDLNEDAERALDDFRPDTYHLLILDVMMPKMSGFELYRLIKKIDGKVKACFLTGLDDFSEYGAYKKEIFPKLNERYFVRKPVTGEDLLERVDYMIQLHDIDYTTEKGRNRVHLQNLAEGV
jgi:DNA-binding response OmpR family regulator